jgi:hypothetical protein
MNRSSRTRLVLALAAAALAALLPLSGQAGARTLSSSLTIHIVGEGTVRAPGGIVCGSGGNSCSAAWNGTSAAQIVATPTEHSVFAGWTGTCSGTQSTCLLVITDGADADVTAVFGYVEVLAVSTTGSGEGAVVSKPAGIDCGQACVRPFTGNTIVGLTAVPKRGSVFTGWSGWCSGTGSNCTVQSAYGTAAVVAHFERKAVPKPKPKPSPQPAGFAVANLGADVAGKTIQVHFRTTQPASVRLGVYRDGSEVTSTGLQVRAGVVSVKLPLDAAATGRYTVLGWVTASGKTRTLRWNVTL